jgi:hypothetical protein
MSLYQDPNYLLMGTGNLRNYSGTAQNPYFYGAENLSGYRYLSIQIRSKDGENHSSNFDITSTSKGPSIEGDTRTNEDIKTWSVSTKSKTFENGSEECWPFVVKCNKSQSLFGETSIKLAYRYSKRSIN